MPKFSFEVLDASLDAEFSAWDSMVDSSVVPDVYYRPGYALACREAGTELVCALVVEACDFRVLVPLLITRLYCGDKNTASGKVAHSPYGYGGLLPLNDSHAPTVEQVEALRHALQQFARDFGVVCLVLRTHPILRQELWFEGVGRSHDVILLKGNQTVSLDLQVWNEQEQRLASLNKGRRSDLKFARRNLTTSWTCDCTPEMRESLATFQVLYDARMRALGAKSFYLFPSEYYSALAHGLEGRLAVGLAWHGSTPVAGVLLLADTQFAHYHLSAANSVGHDLKAATLLINMGASWARQRECRQLHLGGGVADQDSLFRFKQSFGGILFRAATLTVITRHAAFRTLCDLPDAQWPFNMYRAVLKDHTFAQSQLASLIAVN